MERISINVAEYRYYRYTTYYFDSNKLKRDLGGNIHISSDTDRIELESIDFVFSGNVTLNLGRGSKLSFTDCTFQRVKGHQLDNFDCDLNQHSALEFIRCKSPLLRVNNIHSLTIDRCEFSDISIESIKVVEFKSNEFHNLSLTYCSFQAGLTISGNKAKSFALAECQVAGDLKINNTTFQKCTLTEVKSQKGKFEFKRNQIGATQVFDRVRFESISLQDNRGKVLSFKRLIATEANIYRNRCSFIFLNCTFANAKIHFNRQGKTQLESTHINTALRFAKNTDYDIVLDNQRLSKIYFSGNKGSLTLSNILGRDHPDLLDLSDNEFKSISVLDTKSEDSNWQLKVSTCENLSIKNSELSSYKISGAKITNTSVEDCSFSIEWNIKKSDSIKVNKLVKAQLSAIEIESGGSVKVLSSEFSELKLSANRCESIDLVGIKTDELKINGSESNKIKLTDINSSNLTLSDVKAKELSLITSESERSQKLHHCEFNKSTLVSCIIRNYEFTEFILEEFSSEKLDTINTYSKNLTIKACSDFSILVGKNTQGNSSKSNWFFEKIPKKEIEIAESTGIDNFTLLGPLPGQIIDTYELPSIILKQTVFRSFKIYQIQMKLFSADNCRFDMAVIKEVNSGEPEAEMVLQDSRINSLELHKASGKLALSQNNITTSIIEDCQLSLLTIEECKSEDSEFDIDTLNIQESGITEIDIIDSNIGNLSISKVQPSIMKLRDLKLQNLSLDNFERLSDAKGKFELRSINKGHKKRSETFSISESDLSGLNFNSCYFDSFKELSVKESKLDEIKCTATLWPTSVTSTEGKDQQFEIREASRQLKLAMAGHHDKVSELQFHSLEMSAYRRIVRSRGLHPRNWIDRLSLWAGSSNSFGMNWFRPLCWIILFTLLHYTLILFSHSPIHSVTEFCTKFSSPDFFLLFNPTHKFSSLSMGDSEWFWTVLWDFSSRIWSAFFIYQIVAAFRKFRRG